MKADSATTRAALWCVYSISGKKLHLLSICFVQISIYTPAKEYYTHFCNAYVRNDNPLFIPESGFRGTSGALNVIRAIADYGAIGVCCFGAGSALDENDEVNEESQETAISFRMVRNIASLLTKYHGTGNVHSLI